MLFPRWIVFICCLIASSSLATERWPAPHADRLLPLHELYLAGASGKLAKSAQKLLLENALSGLETANVLELLNADFKRSCAPELLAPHEAIISVALRETHRIRDGRPSVLFETEVTFKEGLQKIQGRLDVLAGAAAGSYFVLQPALAQNGNKAILSLEKQSQGLQQGLYQITLEAAGGIKTGFQFFWLASYHAAEIPIVTSPVSGETVFTPNPGIRWLDFKGSALGRCGQSRLGLVIKDPKKGVSWENLKLSEGGNPTVFGRSMGWEGTSGLANGSYQLSLTAQERLQMKGFMLETNSVVARDFSVAAKGFDSCRFNFGVEWDEGESDLTAFHYYGAWIGWSPKFSPNYYRNMLLASSPGRRAQGITPAYFASVIEDMAVNEGKIKYCTDPGTRTLCYQGTAFARKNRSRILDVYREYARETAGIIGAEADIIWFIEPYFHQLMMKQQIPSPFSFEEGQALLEDTYFIIKEYLPFARIVFPLPKEDDQRELWVKAFAAKDFDRLSWHYYKVGNTGIALESLSHGAWVDMHIRDPYALEHDPPLSLAKMNEMWNLRIRSLSLFKPDATLRQRIKSLAPHLAADKACEEKARNRQMTMSAVRLHRDFLEGDYRSLEAHDGALCAKVCEGEHHCRAWSWAAGRCYLKNVRLKDAAAAGVQSGYKIFK
ncbi:MAG: PAN domain-containing protein [Pseudobdellovibrionaceae bacterium]|nr:PAN domain-containing protein [Pseudobdellovibrionaceae bacterium]